MKPIVDEVARKLRDALKDKMDDFEGLYVFGSQVRGDATEDSDVDIVVILGDDGLKTSDTYYDVLSQMMYDYYDVVDLDVHRRTSDSIKRNYIFYDEVVNKGVFYGRT